MSELRHISNRLFTIRELANTGLRLFLADGTVNSALELLVPRPPEHLFVTLVDGHEILVGENEASVGVYFEGIKQIAVAALPPDDIDVDEFDREFVRTLAHEVYHFYQDHMGTIGTDDAEAEAEAFSDKFVEEYVK